MLSEDLARRQLSELRRNLAFLDDLAAKAFASAVNIGSVSHLRFMLASFAVKQIEHSRSILKLGQSVDTVLIARSMLEGLCQLLWALKRPRRRPLMWRAFVFVLDWRLLQQDRSEGKAVDPGVERHIRLGLRRYGRWFLSKEAREALARGQSLPKDPYARNWYGEREVEIFRDVGGQLLYEGAYGPFSEWHHWRPGAFGRLLSFDKATRRFTMTASNPNQVAMALATAFQCLWQTMQLFNSRCRFGMGRDLQRLKKEQLALQK